MNIVKLAKLVDDNPMKSSEKALWYIEHVIRNKGANHLEYPQKNIPFYQYTLICYQLHVRYFLPYLRSTKDDLKAIEGTNEP